jgi:hypothetical protein
MFFSVEYGIRPTAADCVEPRIFNTNCSVAILLKYVQDRVVADFDREIEARLKEENRQVAWLKQLPQTDGDLNRLIDAETKEREAVIPRLNEVKEQLKTLVGIDLCYSDNPVGRLNLNRSSNDPAYTVLAMRSRTFAMGEFAGNTNMVPLAFQVAPVNRSDKVASLANN